jgi:hypothetical protein
MLFLTLNRLALFVGKKATAVILGNDFGSTWVLSSGLALAQQVLHHLSHTPALLTLALINFLPGLTYNHNLPIYASKVAGITGVSYHLPHLVSI